MTSTRRHRAMGMLLVPLFAVAAFLNAALLFAVEPMFTKMVLPLLGGTPSVWNTCLLFFQGALLVGYGYAHVTSRWWASGRQAVVHLALLAAAGVTLPVAVSAHAVPPTEGAGSSIAWLLGELTRSLGVPFVLLAAGAPLFQRWFAGTAHAMAGNPYVLYVASNLGSFVALLAYPTLIEPRWRLGEQSARWAIGYGALALLVAVVAGLAWWMRRRGDEQPEDTRGKEMVMEEREGERSVVVGGGPPRPSPPSLIPTTAWRLRWVLLSFAPSSLLLGVTTFLSTDIAAVPFLWVVPLALYLLTFVLVFARHPPLNRRFLLALQALLVIGLLLVIGANPASRLRAVAALHLVTFFVTTMVCHRELADARPRADHLTEYYLWISIGGLLGGVFNVVIAPLLYDTVIEYPFALILALALRPMWRSAGPARRAAILDAAIPVALFVAVVAARQLPAPSGRWGDILLYAGMGAAGLVAAACYQRPLRIAMAAAALYLANERALAEENDTLLQARSFFGVYRVRRWENFHLLQHGTTTHGGQSLVPSQRTEPLTYYHRDGPLGDLFELVTDSTAARRVALVGLGTGTTACYSRPGERWSYFEIDPLVVAIAREPRLFTYLRDCQPEVRIVLGDARLSLQREPAGSYDLLVLDAFSSDAIPVHLMTREALAAYRRVLSPGGVIAFHISNRYLDLRPVLVELARDARMAGAQADWDVEEAQKATLHYGSRWVALAARAHTLAPLVREAGWEVLAPSAPVRLWTDDYSDVFGVLAKRR